MPSGCEFICENEDCIHVNKGFSFTEAWPLGKIELLINAPIIKRKSEFRDGLIKLKDEGRKYACITYPNEAGIDTEGYRVNYWSPDANQIWQYDIMEKNKSNVASKIEESLDIPYKCPKTNGRLMDFKEVIAEGIYCPHCGDEMKQDRWFTNEI